MARKPREKSGTGIYHVMLRGVNKQDIFLDEEDYSLFRGLLYKMVYYKDEQGKKQPSRCIFYAYCLMPNHVHLLIREAAEDLSTVIKRIAVAYALFYNNKYQHVGHLFQSRFRSEPVNDAAYFFTLMRYIHQNPVAAGLTTSVADYPWSSWQEYENHTKGQTLCVNSPDDSSNTKGLTLCVNVGHVLRQMPMTDLRALVFEPLPKTAQFLDFDNESRKKTDDEVKAFLLESFGLRAPIDLQNYSRERQKDILREAKEFGGSLRQLERLTGITINIIRTA